MSFYEIDNVPGLSRTAKLIAKDPDGSLQASQVSEHAPGPVRDHELLARSLDYPNKFSATGGLNDSLFNDAFSFGASAQRLPNDWNTHAPNVHQNFEERAEARRKGTNGRKASPDQLYIGSFHIAAGELRAIQLVDEEIKRVRVYDAGTKTSDPLHAEILVNDSNLKKALKHELRVRLMTLAQQRGLYVSPFLSDEDLERAKESGCILHYHPSGI